MSAIIDQLSSQSETILRKPLTFECTDEWMPQWGGLPKGTAPLIREDERGRPTLQISGNLRRNVHYGLGVPPPPLGGGDTSSLKTSAMCPETANVDEDSEYVPAVLAALDEVEMIANDESIFSRVKLEPGDVLLLDNRRFLHARDGFEDDDQHRRLLLRYWIRTRARRDWTT